MLKLGKLEKLKITAYDNPKRSGRGKELSFQVNPTELKTRHENQFTRLRGINTSGRSAPYAKSFSDTLSIQLVIDNTIVVDTGLPIPGEKARSVAEQVDDFLTLCAYMDGQIHEPRFLRLQWGAIDFECRLQTAEVKYVRFDEKGNPLRAEIDAVFMADMPDDKRIRLENKKSPDITHTHFVEQGETLPGLCKKVYGDASRYLIVAQANQLNHFRRLEPGREIFFPPLEK